MDTRAGLQQQAGSGARLRPPEQTAQSLRGSRRDEAARADLDAVAETTRTPVLSAPGVHAPQRAAYRVTAGPSSMCRVCRDTLSPFRSASGQPRPRPAAGSPVVAGRPAGGPRAARGRRAGARRSRAREAQPRCRPAAPARHRHLAGTRARDRAPRRQAAARREPPGPARRPDPAAPAGRARASVSDGLAATWCGRRPRPTGPTRSTARRRSRSSTRTRRTCPRAWRSTAT